MVRELVFGWRDSLLKIWSMMASLSVIISGVSARNSVEKGMLKRVVVFRPLSWKARGLW